ncbi:hypothetical protein [Pseudovibrio ascidiaceicola]|uniref:hypothetical protein n=1 Tax=Pseudovibrio ascidiaceicola TaxID=285279 RepID=UPI000D694905|nr:hypothetical protein [Pseudovibrio ascidiaceicola]
MNKNTKKKLQNWLNNSSLFNYFSMQVVGKKRLADLERNSTQLDLRRDFKRPLFNLKNLFPVNTLWINDRNVWPMLRFWVWRYLRAVKEGKPNPKLNPLRMQISNVWRQYYRQRKIAKEIQEVEECPVDFLFFVNQNGVEQTTINDALYNRISDPVFECAQELGKATKIEIIKNNSILNQNRICETQFILPPQHRKIGWSEDVKYWVDFIERLNLELQIKNGKQQLEQAVEHYFHGIETYGRILDKCQPKVIFFVGFEFHQDLICAARERGIISVDLQHGNQTGWGPLYKWWEEMPDEGYSSLPDIFWTWGERDLQHLMSSIPSTRHMPIIGGNLWLSRQKELLSDYSSVEIEKYIVGKSVYLVSLQNHSQINPTLKQIIYSSPDDVVWLIREHPKLKANVDELRSQSNCYVGGAVNDAPLCYLLGLTDLHFTGSSSVVVECCAEGIPSIVLDEDGFSNFQDIVDEKSVSFLASVPAFHNRGGWQWLRSIQGRGLPNNFVVSTERSTALKALKSIIS